MTSREPFGQHGRLFVAVVLLVALGGLMVWSGTLSYDPAMNNYPNQGDVGPQPDDYLNQEVVLGGEVVDTDPVIIETRHSDGTTTFTLTDANDALLTTDEPLEEGDQVTAFGTLTDTSTLSTDRALTREPWETQYMYVVSFLGGLWVAGRFLRGWRFDRQRLAFVARERPLSIRRRKRTDRQGKVLQYDEEHATSDSDEPRPIRTGPDGDR